MFVDFETVLKDVTEMMVSDSTFSNLACLLILDFNANLVLYFECFYFLMFQEAGDQSILTEA